MERASRPKADFSQRTPFIKSAFRTPHSAPGGEGTGGNGLPSQASSERDRRPLPPLRRGRRAHVQGVRSEERRVGKECRARGSPYQEKKKEERTRSSSSASRSM